MAKILPRVRRVLLAAAMLLAAGCLDFEKQTLVLKVSPNAKKAEMLLVYEGLRVQGDARDDLKKAQEQLATLIKDQQRFYLLTNWPFVVELAPSPNDSAADLARKARLKDLLAIRNEGFFLDAKGKLGFWQTVATNDVPKLLEEVNAFAAEALAEQARDKAEQKKKNPGGDEVDDRTLELWENAPKTRPKVFTWENGRLHLLIPSSPEFAEKVRKEAAADAQLQAIFLAPNKIVLQATPRGLHATAGAGGDQPLRLSLADPTKKTSAELNKELLDFARTLPLGIKDGVAADKLIADFLAKQN